MNENSFKDNETNAEMFYSDLNAKIQYHLIENELTCAEVIGTLEILKQEILNMIYEESFIIELIDDEDEDMY